MDGLLTPNVNQEKMGQEEMDLEKTVLEEITDLKLKKNSKNVLLLLTVLLKL